MKLGYTITFMLSLFAIVAAAQPSNDNCDNPIQVNNISGACTNPTSGTNQGATPSGYDPANCFSAGGNDVWYTFVAIGTDVTITVQGNSLNRPEVALYDGTCTTTISELRCGTDNFNIGIAELYRGGLTIGQTYLVRVQGRNNATGTFSLCINNYNPPVEPGSDCPIASILCDKSSFVVQQVTGVGNDPDEADNTCLDQDQFGNDLGNSESSSTWFAWTAANDGTLTFTITPLNPNDDLDFALFELPNGVGNCSGKRIIRCMATACPGPTGLNLQSTDEVENINCDPGEDGFVKFIDMEAGKSYGLLINNFSNTGNGFEMEFGGTGEFQGPEADFAISDPDGTICVGEEISFVDASNFALGSIVEWNWQFGVSANVATSTVQDPPAVFYNSPGLKSIVLTVTTDKGCVVTVVKTIMVECCGDHFDVNGVISNLTCPDADDGAIDVTVTNDYAPYSYVWNTTATTEDITDLAIGAYTVTITDNITCDTVVTFNVEAPPPFNIDTLITMPTCGGGTDGAVALNLSGGTEPYEFNWQNAGFSSDNSLINIPRGDYDVVIRDGNNCEIPMTIAVRELELVLDPSVDAIVPPTCNGFSNGSIAVNIANGLGPYEYDWNDGQGFRGANSLTGLSAGIYTVQVRDANLCVGNFQFNMEDFPALELNFNTLDASCNGVPDGSAAAVVTGGFGNYRYTWSNGESKDSILNLSAGNYNITVLDDNNCEITGGLTIIEPESVNIQVENIVDLLCNGAPTGEVTVLGSGGTMPYNYNIEGSTFQPSPIFAGLLSGTYTIQIEDAQGCQNEVTATVNQPPPLTVDAGEDQTVELGYMVDLFAVANAGGVSFNWTPPDGLSCTDCPNPSAMPARTTTLFVTVTNQDACSATDSLQLNVTVNRPVFAPSAFSPNGDGFNDYFTLFGGPGARLIRTLRIFDRWGNLVFEGTDIPIGQERFGWNGKFNGELMSPGVFAYFAEIEFIDDVTVLKEGDVTIVR